MRWSRIGTVAMAAVAVVASARIGHSNSDEPGWRSTIPVFGSDDPEASQDVVTKVLTNTADTVRFVQASADGIYREVTIKFAATPQRKAADDEIEIVLDDGRQFFVRNPAGTPADDGLGYAITFDFYVPAGSKPAAPGDIAARSRSPLLAAVTQLLESTFVKTAWAAGNDGLSGSFTDVKTYVKEINAPKQGFREALREREIHEGRSKVEACMFLEVKKSQDWVKRLQAWQAEMDAAGLKGVSGHDIGSNPAHAELKATWQQLYREFQQADAYAYAKSIPKEARDKYLKSHTEGVDAVMAKDQIDLDKQALKDRIAALRRCHENPTAPTAIRAKQEGDPARKQISEALDAVELQVEIDSGVREVAAIMNSAAASGLGTLGTTLTGIAGEIEDALLKRSMEDAVASLEKCIVRCCDEQGAGRSSGRVTASQMSLPATKPGMGATSAEEPNYTPGPEENYTPGPARQSPIPPPPQVCRPPVLEGRLTYTVHQDQWLVPDVIWAAIKSRTVINARLKPVPDQPGQYLDDGSTFHFRGATSMLHIAGDCKSYGESWAAEFGDFAGDEGVIISGQVNEDGRLAVHFTAGIHSENIHSQGEICGVHGGSGGHSDSYSAEFEDGCWADPVLPGQPGYVPGRKAFQFSCHETNWSASGFLSQAN